MHSYSKKRLHQLYLLLVLLYPESGSAVDLPAAGALGGEHRGAGQTLAQPPRGAREGAQRCLRQVSLKNFMQLAKIFHC